MTEPYCNELNVYEKNVLVSIRKLNNFFYPQINDTFMKSQKINDDVLLYFMLTIFMLIILVRVFNDLTQQMNNIERNVTRNFINRCECQKRCTICLDNIISDNNKIITECNHEFHFICFIKYVCDSNDREIKCPNCRQYIYSKNRRRENEINQMIHDIIHSRNSNYNIGSIHIQENSNVGIEYNVLDTEESDTGYDTEEESSDEGDID